MQSRIVLVSEEQDFFCKIIPMLMLRKYDELFKYSFDNLISGMHLIQKSVLIINSENAEEKTLDLLNILENAPAIVFSSTKDRDFRKNVYKNGAIACVDKNISAEDFQALLVPVLNSASLIEKNSQYRELLVKNKLIHKNNEVYLDYKSILEKELENIKNNSESAVFMAISPDEKTKFLLKPNQIETIILNNVRKDDVLMNFAPNKYFLLLHNTDVKKAENIWEKIKKTIPEKIYAGLAVVSSKTETQLVNEALNKLHTDINKKDLVYGNESNAKNEISNFKFYKQEFNKRMDNVIMPVFYHIKQKYDNKIFSTTLELNNSENEATFYIKGRYSDATFRITTPGLSVINVDITYNKNQNIMETKRINFSPEEFEEGILEDLLEQYIAEYKESIDEEKT